MKQSSFNKRFGDNELEVMFSCGHPGVIRYNGKKTLYERIEQAERNGLCRDCKEKKLKKENDHAIIPMWYYFKYLKNSRNIVVGEWRKSTKEVEVWLPHKKYMEYTQYMDRIFYELYNRR